jgi:hypothetical protein
VTEAQGFGGGEYELTVNRNVTACAYVASVGDPATADGSGGFVRTRQNPNGQVGSLLVSTFFKEAAQSDQSFHLIVVCP